MADPTFETFFPRKVTEGSFLGNLNVDTRFEGRATPSFVNLEITNSADVLHYFVDALETVAPSGTTYGGGPRQYAGANKSMFRLDNGARTTDTTFNDVVQGMVICDAFGASQVANDPPPAASTFDSSEKCLLVGFGSSTNPRCAIRQLDTDTSPWTVHTSSTFAQFWLIARAGADLYAVCDAGVAVLGEWRVSKCPAGNDPTLAASWFNGLEVGTPEWGITGLVAIGNSVVVGKPDGLYYYHEQGKRYYNALPHLEKAPHAVNGKGMKAVTGGVLYPTHDGKLYFFDGVSAQDVTPLKGQTLPRDVATQRITGIADNGDTVALVTECWQNTTQWAGLTVITRIAGTYTDVTSSVTNRSLQNGADVGGFGAAADDAIFVGADVPIEAIVFRVTRNVNAAVQSFTTPQYSNGTAGASAPFDTSFSNFTAIVDGSILSTAATSLVNTGFPPGASNAVITCTDIDAFSKNTLTQIAFGGSVGTLTKFWWRLKRTTTTGFTASTTIDEVEIVPGRAGMPNGTGSVGESVFTQSTNYTNRDRAGGITHVWLGKRVNTVGFVWHDVYAVHTYGGVWALAWHTGRIANGNWGQSLVLWGRYRQFMISESTTRDPGRTLVPHLCYYHTNFPGPLLNLTRGGTYFGDPNRLKELEYFYVDAMFAQPYYADASDDFSLYIQWDEKDIVHVGSWSGAPARINCEGVGGQGRRLQAWITMNYAFNNLQCVELVAVRAKARYVGDVADYSPDPRTIFPGKELT